MKQYLDLIDIRRAVVADAAALAEFAARTFAEAFGTDNNPQDLQQHLLSSYGLPQQTRELIDADRITIVAFEGLQLRGYTQIRRGPQPSCVSQSSCVELQRFCVDRCAQGRGLAQQLMALAMSAARELGATHLWLGVWERNPRATAFYGKCGFIDVGGKDFMVGHDCQKDRVLVAPAMPMHAVSAQDNEYVAAFEGGDFPTALFDHAAHVRLAYVYVATGDADAASTRMRTAIQNFLLRNKVDPAKYHETLTRAWLLAVRHFMRHSNGSVSASEFIRENPRLLDKRVMLTHYSAEVLFSPDARAGFVEPDLDPIPTMRQTQP